MGGGGGLTYEMRPRRCEIEPSLTEDKIHCDGHII